MIPFKWPILTTIFNSNIRRFEDENSQFVTYQGDNLGNPWYLQKGIPIPETFIMENNIIK